MIEQVCEKQTHDAFIASSPIQFTCTALDISGSGALFKWAIDPCLARLGMGEHALGM